MLEVVKEKHMNGRRGLPLDLSEPVSTHLAFLTLETNKNSEEKNNKHWVRNKQ